MDATQVDIATHAANTPPLLTRKMSTLQCRTADSVSGLEDQSARVGHDQTRPEELPRRLQRLAHAVAVLRAALTLGQGGTPGGKLYQVVLTGRATSVPFTAVLTGPERTTTDNTKAAWSCAVPYLRR
jgi:hypothetical protein